MGVYAAILGGMEGKAMDFAQGLNELLDESLFVQFPFLQFYLEGYTALDVHVMVRFGRWKDILALSFPNDEQVLMYRAASIAFAKSLAHASLGSISEARKELEHLETIRSFPDMGRVLHNNPVAKLFELDSVMARGEIAYREGKYNEAFSLLREAAAMQDALAFDEPWGKMQPVRHALGGLLLEQGHVEEATSVFRSDLKRYPKNPFGLVGLIRCLKAASNGTGACCSSNGAEAKSSHLEDEIKTLEKELAEQRELPWSDFDVRVPCECCQRD
jgi:tetratricopeptide (TPR) repeat protein